MNNQNISIVGRDAHMNSFECELLLQSFMSTRKCARALQRDHKRSTFSKNMLQ
jgi:hypothetical protein